MPNKEPITSVYPNEDELTGAGRVSRPSVSQQLVKLVEVTGSSRRARARAGQ